MVAEKNVLQGFESLQRMWRHEVCCHRGELVHIKREGAFFVQLQPLKAEDTIRGELGRVEAMGQVRG